MVSMKTLMSLQQSYSEDDVAYGDNYSSESKDLFDERVTRIYEPKVDFLFHV